MLTIFPHEDDPMFIIVLLVPVPTARIRDVRWALRGNQSTRREPKMMADEGDKIILNEGET